MGRQSPHGRRAFSRGAGADARGTDVKDPEQQRALGPKEDPREGRRSAAAAGAAGGAVQPRSSPAPALSSTTVEPGAVAPAVVVLTDAATIAVDASQGNDFRVTIAGNRTMGNPSNPTDGQKIIFQVTQGTAGLHALLRQRLRVRAGLPQPTLSTTAGDTDLLALHLQRGQGQVAAGRVRDRVPRLPSRWAPSGCSRLPTGRPARLLWRAVPGRRLVRGHHGRHLVRGLLVVGVPVRAVHGGPEVRAVGRVQRDPGRTGARPPR